MKNFYKPLSKILACVSIFFYTNETTAQTAISIDFQTQRYLDDVSELDREKYFNIHMIPNKDHTDADMQVLEDWGVTQGRSFWGAFGRYREFLKTNKIFPQDSQIEKDGLKNIEYTKSQHFYKHITRQMVVTDHPSAMIHMGMDTEEAGHFAAHYFKHNYEDHLRPLYYEPVNEPYVHADEFTNDGEYTEGEVRRKTAEYFRDIGKAFKEEGLDTKILGYSSAWPSMELWDFGHWQSRMKMFMDVAGDYVDGISTHLYDGINVTGQATERSGSNADAILDLIETYSFIKWDSVKDHAITEYGGISKGYEEGYSDIESIQTVRSINHLIFGLMDREDRMLITIPFITGKSTWHYGNNFEPYGADLWKPVKESVVNGKATEFEFTEKEKFYDLWANVSGKRVRCSSSNPDVFVQVFVQDTKAYICLNNIAEDNQDVELQFLSSLGDINAVNKRSLKIYQNEPAVYIDENLSNSPSKVTLESHETVILTYDLQRAITFNKKSIRKDYYSKTYMQEIEVGETLKFDFNNISGLTSEGEARLRMSIGRKHDVSKKPTIKFNGVSVSTLDNWKGYDQANRDDFFGAIEIPVPYHLVKKNNTVEFKFSDEGGMVSSVVLSVNSIDKIGNKRPFLGNKFELPTTIEAEDFDLGGQNVGYYSLDNSNSTKRYRLSEGVNIQDRGEGYEIVLNEKEWTSYSLSVPENAVYNLSVSGRALNENAALEVTVNNEALTEPLVLSTDGISETSIELPSGDYAIQMMADKGMISIDKFELSNAQTLSDEISFTSNNTEVKAGETNTFEVDYTTSKNRDIIIELWGDAFMLGQVKTTVEAGTSTLSLPMYVFAEPLNYENLEVVARIVNVNSMNPVSIAEDVLFEFEYDPILSLENDLLEHYALTVFPNPSSNNQKMGIRGKTLIHKIDIIGMDGKVYDQFNYSIPNKEVNFNLKASYPKGVYLIKVYGNENNFVKKIIIQ